MPPMESVTDVDADEILKQVAASLSRAGCATYREAGQSRLRGECEAGEIVATLDGEWLKLNAAAAPRAGGGGEATDAEFLFGNAALGGGARWDRPLGEGTRRLTADVDVSVDASLPQRIEAAVTGAVAALRQSRSPSPRLAIEAGTRVAAPSLARWDQQLCGLGYAVHRHGDGDLRVELPGQSEFRTARFVTCPAGGFTVGFEFDPAPQSDRASTAPAPVCTRAVAVAVLGATAALRAVRASLVEEGGSVALRLEAWISSEPPAAEIDVALEALGVAVDQCAAEIAVLGRSAAVAGAYLAVHEPAPSETACATPHVVVPEAARTVKPEPERAPQRDPPPRTRVPARAPMYADGNGDDSLFYGPLQQSLAPQ